MSRVYKILTRTEWETALALGSLVGSALDLADGFIHLSSAEQVAQTARLHFHGKPDLVLLECETVAMGSHLRWEPSRGGQLFPHYYGALPVSAVIETHPLPLDADGTPTPGPLRA